MKAGFLSADAPMRDKSLAARIAAARFRIAALQPSADLADEFAVYVARCLDCPVRDVIGPDLATRLERAGVARELAMDASERFDSLIESRHDGAARDERIRSCLELVGALERAFDQA